MSDDLPRRHLTLPQFCKEAKRILEDDDIPAFVKFVLNGVHDDYQIVVDAIQDRVDDIHPITALRDYDSLLAIHKDVLFHADITLSPKAPNYLTLRKDVYINIPIMTDKVRSYHPHRIYHQQPYTTQISRVPRSFPSTRYPTSALENGTFTIPLESSSRTYTLRSAYLSSSLKLKGQIFVTKASIPQFASCWAPSAMNGLQL